MDLAPHLEDAVLFGNRETERAYRQSGCSNLTSFLLSPFCRDAPKIVLLSLENSFYTHYYSEYDIPAPVFLVEGVKQREERSEEGGFLRFLDALPTSCTSLEIILDWSLEEEEEDQLLITLCQSIASPLCTLQQLALFDCSSPSGKPVTAHSCSMIADALRHNTSLQELVIDSTLCSEEILVPALIGRSSSASPLQSLRISIGPYLADGGMLSGLFTGLANGSISLHGLHCFFSDIAILSEDTQGQLAEMFRRNSSLTSLSLQGLLLSGEVVLKIFTFLEKNFNLISLSLKGCTGENWPSISTVLDCLRINGIITQLNIHNTPLEGQNDAAIGVQLAKNRANVEHMKVFRPRGSTASAQVQPNSVGVIRNSSLPYSEGQNDAAIKFQGAKNRADLEHTVVFTPGGSTASAQVQPNSVRLFLCGRPYSGKSTLSLSLAIWAKHTHSSLTNLLSCAKLHTPQRTRGIEVTNLEKDGVKISLWDLAGQKEFYTFHHYMLPTLTNEAIPSMFLFVWNPIQGDQASGKGKLKAKSVDGFRDDFNYWLRFISSKTLKSVKFRPQVLVAITRADKRKQTRFTKTWIEDIFLQCEKEFKDYLHLDIKGVFEVDARDPHNVQELALHVFDVANSLLKSVPHIYKACNDARNILAEMVHMKPLMTKDDFFHLCEKELHIHSDNMKEAIAHSLNNSGDLIYFIKSALMVVVDVKWFCHHIMGNLLYFGMSSENKPHYEHGFFPLKCLEDLLEEDATSMYSHKRLKSVRFRFMELMKKNKSLSQQQEIKGEDLVKVLIELGLACQLDGKPGIFIPASLHTGHHRSKIQPWEYLKGEDTKTHMGRRLRCKNANCTFFTPGFFPALQITFHQSYHKKHEGLQVTLKEDVIAFACDGVEVLMEFCHLEGEEQFIDILIQSRLDFDHTVKWMNEEILEKVDKVCAGPRGLQGVELAHEVIQPACVEGFMCLDERKTRAISLEVLRASLKGHLEKDRYPLKFKDCLKNAYHTWQTDNNNGDPIISLLGNEETCRIVESFRQSFIMDIDDALGKNTVRETSCLEKPVFSSTLSGKERELIFDKVDKVDKKVEEMHKDIQKILHEMDYMCNAILPKLQQKVEELFTFSKEGEATRLPRFFLVMECIGKLRRIIAGMVPGLKNVRLELLCEHGPHLVDNQRGLEFETLEDGPLKSGLPYIITVLKVARVALRVGAHVFAGLGDSVPDFARVLALIEDTPKGLPAYTGPDIALFKDSQSRMNFKQGQQWLMSILSNHGCSTRTRIREVFGLTCVRYPDSRIRWLCDQHCAEVEGHCILDT